MKLRNLTPHVVVIQGADGSRLTLPSEGQARITSRPGARRVVLVPEVGDGKCHQVTVAEPQTWGAVEGLPDPQDGILYVVSLLVLGRPEVQARGDCVAPGTGPNDGAIRIADGPRKGQIEAATCLVRG